MSKIRDDEDAQRLVDIYLSKTKIRPQTTWKTPALLLVLMLVLPFGAAYLWMRCVDPSNPVWCYVAWYLIIDLVLLRLFFIKMVRCYQHYASEELRSFCMCMPSCSEYAIAVLKKYLLAVAVFKIIYRLTKTCDGEKKIDLP